MGGGQWSDQTYNSIQRDYSTKSTAQIFKSKTTKSDMSPKDLKFRESRDSADHPESLAVAFFLDVTASMGDIPEHLIKNKLGSLMNTLIKHGLKDAHLLFGAITDHYANSSILQVGQYEAETTKLDKWLSSIHIEGGGGGQGMESYPLAWLFASRHTSIDCFEKRGQKGFLFTAGDEFFHSKIEASALQRIFGYKEAQDMKAEDLLAEARRTHHVFHIYIETGYNCLSDWQKVMGENVIGIKAEERDSIAEIVASTVALVHGANIDNIVKDFDSKTASSVTNALANVRKDVTRNSNQGVMAL